MTSWKRLALGLVFLPVAFGLAVLINQKHEERMKEEFRQWTEEERQAATEKRD